LYAKLFDFFDFVIIITEFNVERIKKRVHLHKRTQSFKNVLEKLNQGFIPNLILLHFSVRKSKWHRGVKSF